MAWLRIFDGESYEGRRFELPKAGPLFAGRGRDTQLVLARDVGERRHFKLEGGADRWTVQDMGNTRGTEVNGEPLNQGARPLEHADEVSVVALGVFFETREEVRNRALESAIELNPGSEAPFQVWADWLQEQGDPLGERIAQAVRGASLPVGAWAGGLGGPRHSWVSELGWRFGLLDSVTLRSNGHRTSVRALLSRLFHLRAARFLRVLRVDLSGLGASTAEQAAEHLWEMAPHLPRTLRVLDLGYGAGAADVEVPTALQVQLPHLESRRVFRASSQARLVPDEKGARLRGLEVARPVWPGLSIDLLWGRAAFTLPTDGRATPLAGGRPAVHAGSFVLRAGRWYLRLGENLEQRVTVNGQRARVHGLMPDDLIEIDGVRLRFELSP